MTQVQSQIGAAVEQLAAELTEAIALHVSEPMPGFAIARILIDGAVIFTHSGPIPPQDPNDFMPDRRLAIEMLVRIYTLRAARFEAETGRVLPPPVDWQARIESQGPGRIAGTVEVGRGWADLVEAMLHMAPFTVSDLKEKYGGLSVYAPGNLSEEQRAAIGCAEFLSEYICERCGAPGNNMTVNGMAQTLCNDHAPSS
jgi:hypothetical protein